MSSNAADFLKNQKNLKEYRLSVDRQLMKLFIFLKSKKVIPALANTFRY